MEENNLIFHLILEIFHEIHSELKNLNNDCCKFGECYLKRRIQELSDIVLKSEKNVFN